MEHLLLFYLHVHCCSKITNNYDLTDLHLKRVKGSLLLAEVVVCTWCACVCVCVCWCVLLVAS